MKRFFLLLSKAFCLIFLVTALCCCGGTNRQETIDYDEIEGVTSLELVDELAKLPVVNVETRNIILPNGLHFNDFDVDLDAPPSSRATVSISPVDAKNAIIKRLAEKALYLTKDEYFQFSDEGKDRPAQDGLAFVFGSRDIAQRARYTWKKIYTPCSDYLYGLDCSGYVYKFFGLAGISLPVGTANQLRQESVLENALKNVYPNLKLTVENLGQIPIGQCESGDIVYWHKEDKKTADHIGMFILTDSGLVLANSSGHPENCESNKGKNGGPLVRDLAYSENSLTNWPYGYSVVRINVADAWTLSLRCANQSYDLLHSVISVLQTANLDETFSITCADYDGDPLNLVFHVRYNKDSQDLNLSLYLKNDGREDAIEVKLDTEDTGYVNMRKVNDNGGCYAQIRLRKGNFSGAETRAAKPKVLNCRGCTIQ